MSQIMQMECLFILHEIIKETELPEQPLILFSILNVHLKKVIKYLCMVKCSKFQTQVAC